MGAFIGTDDLKPFAEIDLFKATAMIEDAEASAIIAAPCLATINTAPVDETAEQLALRLAKIAAVKAILRGAIVRWHEAGTGAMQAVQVGPFGQTMDTRAPRRGMFYPSELEQLRDMCTTTGTGDAFSIDTVGIDTIHQPWCALNFGADYCSCGADIAGYPLYEWPDG